MKGLLSKKQIQSYVEVLAKRISDDFYGTDVVLICILKGSYLFAADLARALKVENTIDFMQLSSYVGTSSTINVICIKDIGFDITDKHVIVVEDIIDTGHTANWIFNHLIKKQPASLSICALLTKTAQLEVDIQFDLVYTGVDVSDKFVVGYGLDHNEKFRNMSTISQL